MAPDQHVSLGHLDRQLIVNFLADEDFTSNPHHTHKTSRRSNRACRRKCDLHFRKRWAVAKHSAPSTKQLSQCNLYLLIIQSPLEFCLCVHAMLPKKFARKSTLWKYGDIGNWRKDKLIRGNLNKAVNSWMFRNLIYNSISKIITAFQLLTLVSVWAFLHILKYKYQFLDFQQHIISKRVI